MFRLRTTWLISMKCGIWGSGMFIFYIGPNRYLMWRSNITYHFFKGTNRGIKYSHMWLRNIDYRRYWNRNFYLKQLLVSWIFNKTSPWGMVFLEVINWSKNTPSLMEPEGSLACSRDPVLLNWTYKENNFCRNFYGSGSSPVVLDSYWRKLFLSY
jgi:hypothetical protein